MRASINKFISAIQFLLTIVVVVFVLFSGGLFGFFKSLVGQTTLDRTHLQPVLDQFKDSLIGKNVAQEIAEKLNISTKTIENHMTKALKLLKDVMLQSSVITALCIFFKIF